MGVFRNMFNIYQNATCLRHTSSSSHITYTNVYANASLKVYTHINASRGGAQAGLQELTPDISKLVNLKTLMLQRNGALMDIPESISCLQKLEQLCVYGGQIDELPAGLAKLANLTSLDLAALDFNDLRIPFGFQVGDPRHSRTLAT
jgi:hypothetical protein